MASNSLKLYRIETGDDKAQARGKDMQSAIVAAFKKRAPKNPALITGAISESLEDCTCAKCGDVT